MAKTGFTLNGNLIEVSAGKIALTNLISLGSKPFQFEDFDIFRENSTETALLDFIPNNHIFAVEPNEALSSPNTIIELKNISDSSPGITNNLSVRNGDLIIGHASGADTFATITGVSRQKVIDRGTITTSTRTNVSRVSDTPVRIKKQNNASYSPDTGRFTFGTDIQFGFSDGDRITQVEILKNSTTSILNSPATIGGTIYPLEVFDKAKNDAGQISFKLRKVNSPDKTVIFKLPPVSSVTVSNAGSSLYNGKYFYHPPSNHYYNNKNANPDGNPVNSSNGFGFFKFISGRWRWAQQAGSGGPSSTQLGGSGQSSINVSANITEAMGFWSVPTTNLWAGTSDHHTDPMTFSLVTRDSPDLGALYTANSPDKLKFREDALIRFTRNNTVTQKNFLSIVPPTLDSRLNSAQDLQDLSDNVEATTSIGMKSLFSGFEEIDEMYNTTSSDITSTEESDLYSGSIAFQKVLDNVNKKIGFYDSVVKTKLDKSKNYHDKSGNEFIVEGTVKIQDPDLTVGNPSTGIKTFTDSPVGLVPAPYIAEFGSASRAFSTFDGPWDSNSTTTNGSPGTASAPTGKITEPEQSIHTKGDSPGHPDFVQQMSVPTLSFKNRFILGDFSSPTNISVVSTTNINHETDGFDFKMPILIEETDELLGTTELVEYFLLLKQET
jgi:hypothetical protein